MDVRNDSNNDQAVGDEDDEHSNHSMEPVLKMPLYPRLQNQDCDSSPEKQEWCHQSKA